MRCPKCSGTLHVFDCVRSWQQPSYLRRKKLLTWGIDKAQALFEPRDATRLEGTGFVVRHKRCKDEECDFEIKTIEISEIPLNKLIAKKKAGYY